MDACKQGIWDIKQNFEKPRNIYIQLKKHKENIAMNQHPVVILETDEVQRISGKEYL